MTTATRSRPYRWVRKAVHKLAPAPITSPGAERAGPEDERNSQAEAPARPAGPGVLPPEREPAAIVPDHRFPPSDWPWRSCSVRAG